MRTYLAGPMSGIPLHNFPAFAVAASRLRAMGHTVISPAEMDGAATHEDLDSIPRSEFLRRDVRALSECDAIAVLPGWRSSPGATFEVDVARALGMPVLDAETGEPYVEPRESILEEAQRLVEGPRCSDYDHPANDFRRTGRKWGVTLEEWRTSSQRDVPAYVVALCMIDLKTVREAHKPKRDNRVDIAGYAYAEDRALDAPA